MNKPVLVLALVVGMACWATAFAQDAPLRGVGLLALNAAGDSDSGLGNAQGRSIRNVMVDVPDEGGGGDAHRVRGSSDIDSAAARPGTPKTPDALPPRAIQQGDPSAPSVITPKRPSYRWQSLVPGAIK
jgi:hypothetical protein